MLPIDILKLEVKQRWLSETEEFANGTPSNRIIFKVLPNIGATHGEILLYKFRNTIGIEPNVPVLLGKKNAVDEITGEPIYPNLLVVYKQVKKAKVVEYLKSDISPKKIFCTPEAYLNKVKPAIEESEFNLYEDFFMLIDECDKLVKDVDYRGKIVLPLEDFFKFKHKAMISATALVPSDERFKQHGFRILKVRPNYNYSQAINLIATNNVLGALAKVLKENKGTKHFIFVNSTDLIHSIIKALKIEDRSTVFCAEKSVKKLKNEGFKSTYTELQNFKEFNFLTSRFNAAVDIKIKDRPNIIMITDVNQAHYTMLDPYSDSVQIIGRLRNGVNKVYHISNFDMSIPVFDEVKLSKQIADKYQEYQNIKHRSTAQNLDAKETLQQALNGTDISSLVNEDGVLDYFMIDNFLLDNKVKAYYKHKDIWFRAYKALKNFKVDDYNWKFNISDNEIHSLNQNLNLQERCRTVVEMLHKCDTPIIDGVLQFYLGEDENALRKDNSEIANWYDMLGYELIKTLDYSPKEIKKHIAKREKKNSFLERRVVTAFRSLYTKFPVVVDEKFLIAQGQKLFTKFKIKKRFSGNDITKYYNAIRTSNNFKVKVYKLMGYR